MSTSVQPRTTGKWPGYAPSFLQRVRIKRKVFQSLWSIIGSETCGLFRMDFQWTGKRQKKSNAAQPPIAKEKLWLFTRRCVPAGPKMFDWLSESVRGPVAKHMLGSSGRMPVRPTFLIPLSTGLHVAQSTWGRLPIFRFTPMRGPKCSIGYRKAFVDQSQNTCLARVDECRCE